MAYKVFTNGSVLNASEVNDNLMNQAVITFSNSTARGSAITAPVEGMLTYLEDTNAYEFWNGTAWANPFQSGLTHINTTSITALSSQSFNNVFSAEFDNYFAICDFLRSTPLNITFRLRSSGTDESGSNYIQQNGKFIGATNASSASTGTSGFINTVGGDSRFYASIKIFKPFLADKTVFLSDEYTSQTTVGTIGTEHQLSNSYDGFTITPSAGTITGTIRIYGYKN